MKNERWKGNGGRREKEGKENGKKGGREGWMDKEKERKGEMSG